MQLPIAISAYHTYAPSEVDNEGMGSFPSLDLFLAQRWQWLVTLDTAVAGKLITLGVHKILKGHDGC